MNTTEEIPFTSLELNSTLLCLNSTNNSITTNEMMLLGQPSILKLTVDYLLIFCTVVTLISMGCTLTVEQIVQNFKRPVGIIIGLFSQFVALPLTGFSAAKIIALDGLTATGVLLVSCCPGGLISNVITYYLDGDVSLSVAMTAASTFMAMGLMPLNLWIYGRSFETGYLSIPYAKLATSLLMVTSPVMAGMLVRWKWPRAANIAAKVGSCLSLVFVIILTILVTVWFPNLIAGGQSKMYTIVFSLPFLGMTLGYILAAVFGQTRKVCKTIAIESGLQNGPLALTMITLSFPIQQQMYLLRIPVCYGLATSLSCTLFCIVYQAYKKCANSEEKTLQQPAKENNEKEEQDQIEIVT